MHKTRIKSLSTIILMGVCLLFIAACGDKVVSQSSLTIDGKKPVYERRLLKKNGENNFLVQDFYTESGQKRTDPFTLYSWDEVKDGDFNYYDGHLKITGTFTQWYQNKEEPPKKGNEAKQIEVVLERGRPDGKWTSWTSSGKKETEGFYKNGVKEGLWTDWLSGKKHWQGEFKRGQAEGLWVLWKDNGQKKLLEGKFNNGKAEGVWHTYPHTGQIVEQNYQQGLAQGARTITLPTGKKIIEGQYKQGLKEGLWITLNKDGQKKEEAWYEEGERNGLYQLWWPNGQLQIKGAHQNKMRSGLWTLWDENGQKRYEGFCKDDVKDGEWTAWLSDGTTCKASFKPAKSFYMVDPKDLPKCWDQHDFAYAFSGSATRLRAEEIILANESLFPRN